MENRTLKVKVDSLIDGIDLAWRVGGDVQMLT